MAAEVPLAEGPLRLGSGHCVTVPNLWDRHICECGLHDRFRDRKRDPPSTPPVSPSPGPDVLDRTLPILTLFLGALPTFFLQRSDSGYSRRLVAGDLLADCGVRVWSKDASDGWVIAGISRPPHGSSP